MAELSKSLKRALAAVDAGKVERRSNGKRSIYVGPRGVGMQSLALAKTSNFIEDDWSNARVAISTSVRQALTPAGRAALQETGR